MNTCMNLGFAGLKHLTTPYFGLKTVGYLKDEKVHARSAQQWFQYKSNGEVTVKAYTQAEPLINDIHNKTLDAVITDSVVRRHEGATPVPGSLNQYSYADKVVQEALEAKLPVGVERTSPFDENYLAPEGVIVMKELDSFEAGWGKILGLLMGSTK
ncbi:MAG: hypothetical protein U0003_01330 [Vampirovibrionales bacterium]